jgi:hypothetical protein
MLKRNVSDRHYDNMMHSSGPALEKMVAKIHVSNAIEIEVHKNFHAADPH